MTRSLFVTGTDTGVGKTRVSCALIRAARRAGIDAVGYKPVASGCEWTAQGWRNEDALALRRASGDAEPYESINPIALPDAIAPHLAARALGQSIDPQKMLSGHTALASRHEWVVVEGAGGWRVPLHERLEFADWVSQQGWPVLLVVGLRLGCINHALLSAEAIAMRAPLLGWVANCVPPLQANWQDNLACLRELMPAPCLGVVGMAASPQADETALGPLLTVLRKA